MKALILTLERRLRRLPPLILMTLSLLYLVVVAAIDFACPSWMSFTLFYLIGAGLVGWFAANQRWGVTIAFATAVVLIIEEFARKGVPAGSWAATWNVITRLTAYFLVAWMALRLSRFTRTLGLLVEQQTSQWKSEAERHQATATRLAEALERFEQVITNISEVFWLSDVQKREVIYVSPAYEHIWGRPCGELYRDPKTWVEALHPADRETMVRQSLTTQAAGGYDAEYRIVRPDGTERWIRARAFPVRNAQGEVCRIAGLAEDITERRKTRETLQMQAAILENMAEGVVVTNEQGMIVQMNPAAERMWGLGRNEVVGKPVKVLSTLPEPESTDLMNQVLAALQSEGTWRGTFTDRKKGGELIVAEAVINRLEVQGQALMVAVEQDVTERVRAEEQLQLQAKVFDSMAEAVIVLDEQGVMLLTNPASETMLGYGPGELKGRFLGDLAGYSPEKFQHVFATSVEQVKREGFAMGEYIARRKDGTLLQVETRSSGIVINNRSCVVLVGEDVTQRRQAEQALRQSEESLRVFLDALPEAAALLDWDGTIVFANETMSQRLGISTTELKGKEIFSLVPEDVIARRRAAFEQAIRGRKPVRFDDQRAGRHFISYASPVLDPAGNVSRVAVFALDITERKLAEQALAQSEKLYRTLFDLSPDGILLEDGNGTILDTNQALCETFGYARQELPGQDVRRLVPPEHWDQVEAHLAALRAGQGLEHEVWNVRKNGERCLMRLSERPLALPDGRPAVLVVARDITASRRTETLKEALLSLGTKLATVQSAKDAARAVYATADAIWSWDAGTLDLLLPDTNRLETLVGFDIVDGRRQEVIALSPPGPVSPAALKIMTQGAELVSRKQDEAPDPVLIPFGDASRPSASLMFAPVRSERRAVGLISVQSYRFNAFTDEDLRTLQALADYCGGALERLRAEAVVRESEQKYRALVETTGTGYLILDLQGRVLDANSEYIRLSGHQDLVQIRGRSVVEWTAPEDREQNQRAIEECIRTGSVRNLELTYNGPGGMSMPVEISGTVLPTSQGQTILSLCWDISQRRRAESTKQAFLSLGPTLATAATPVEAARAIYAAADLLWKWDSGSLDLLVPGSDQTHTVLALDVIDGQRRELACELEATELTPRTRRIIAGGAELILRQPGKVAEAGAVLFGDTSRPSASIMTVPVRADKTAVGVLSVQSYAFNAFTEADLQTLQALSDYCAGALRRLAAEAARHESEKLLRAFYESPGALRGVIELLEDDVLFLSANTAQAATYGRTAGTLCRTAGKQLNMPPELRDLWMAKFRQSAERDETVSFEYPTEFRAPGTWRQAIICPLPMPGAARPHFAYASVDITERKQAEKTRETLLALGAKLGMAKSPVDAAKTIYAAADSLWKWDAATLDLRLPGSDQVVTVLALDVVDGQRREVAPGPPSMPASGRMLRIMAHGAELILRKPGEVPADDFYRVGDITRLAASLMYVPVRREGKPIGVLSIQSYTQDAFTQEDLRTLQALADHCAGTLDRLWAEASLRQRLERDRAIIASAMDAFYSLDFEADPGGAITEVNDAFCRLSGYSRDELLQMRMADLEAIESPEEVARHGANILVTGGDRFETRHRGKNGELYDVEISASPLAGSSKRVFGFARNITERKRSELLRGAFLFLGEKLGTSSSPVEAARAVYAAADHLWQWDSASLSLYSPETERIEPVLYHDTVDGQRGEVALPFLVGAPSSRMRRIMQQGAELTLRQAGEQVGTDAVRFGDLSRVSMSLITVPIRREGRPIGILSIQSYARNAFSDDDLKTLQAIADYCGGALERLRAQQALRQREELQRTIITTAMDGFYALDFAADPHGAFTEVNEAFCRMTGYDRQDLLRMCMSDLEAAETPEQVSQHGKRIVGVGADRFESRHRCRDGREIPVEISASRLSSEGSQTFGFVRDITDRKRAELTKEAFLSLGPRLGAASSPREVAQAICASADLLWKWDAASMQLLSEEDDWMHPVLFFDVLEGQRQEVPAGRPQGYPLTTRLRRILQHGAELISKEQSTAGDEFVTFGDKSRLSASMMYVPLAWKGKPYGVLSIQSYTADAYTADDLRTLQALADHCGGALARIQSEEALRKAHAELEQRVRERTEELQAANAALRENEQRLNLALDASNAGTWSWDATSGESSWDDRNHALYGLDAQAPKSFDVWLDRICPQDRQRLQARMQQIIQANEDEVWDEEFRVLHPTKGERWMAGLGRVERDATGKPVRLSGINLDITERKRVEQALRDSETKYRRLHETMTDAFAQVDMDGHLTEFNRAYQEMLGYSDAELRTLTYQDVTSPKWHALEARIVAEQILPRGYSDVYEKEYLRKDGTALPIEIRTFLLRDTAAQPAAMWAIVRDITERKRTEAALREAHDRLEDRVRARTAELEAANQALRTSEERYRSLVNNLNVGVYRNKPGRRGHFIQVNPALARMHGYDSPEELAQIPVSELYQRPAERQKFLSDLLRAGTVSNYELRLRKKDGTPIYGSVNAAVHRNDKGEVEWIDGVLEDITERKRAEEALMQAERLQNAILNNIPDPLWLKDTTGRFLAVNRAFASFYGKTVESIVGNTVAECNPVEAARMTGEDNAVLRHRRSILSEARASDAQGQFVWFEVTKSPLLNQQGQVTGTVGIARNITERKQTATLLQAQRDLGISLGQTADMTSAANILLNLAISLTGIDSGGVYLIDESTGGMRLVTHRGGSPAFVKAVSYWEPDSPQMRLIQKGQPAFAHYREFAFGQDDARRAEGLKATALIPLCHEGKAIGAIGLGSHTEDAMPPQTRLLLEALAVQAAGAFTRLRAEGERHRLERQLLEISDREQARIGHDIHDGLCQHLVSLAFDANTLQNELRVGRRPEARTARRIATYLDQAITEARQLSRGLFPVRLERDGLAPALEELARSTRKRFKVRCDFSTTGVPGAIDNTTATHLYRVAQEAVTNAVRHSRSPAISIRLRARPERLELNIADTGTGISDLRRHRASGMGLHIMDYRARTLGGILAIKPGRRGGTVVSCCVPRARG